MTFDIVLFLDCSIISNHSYYFDGANNLNDIVFIIFLNFYLIKLLFYEYNLIV